MKVNDWSTEELAGIVLISDTNREYYDGLLIYEISDRMIWQAAGLMVQDYTNIIWIILMSLCILGSGRRGC